MIRGLERRVENDADREEATEGWAGSEKIEPRVTRQSLNWDDSTCTEASRFTWRFREACFRDDDKDELCLVGEAWGEAAAMPVHDIFCTS